MEIMKKNRWMIRATALAAVALSQPVTAALITEAVGTNLGAISTNVNVTAEGTVDWALWTSSSAAPSQYKNGTPVISDLLIMPGTNVNYPANNSIHVTYSWTDGGASPTEAEFAPNDPRLTLGGDLVGSGSRIYLTIAGATIPRTVIIRGSVRDVGASITASLTNATEVTTHIARGSEGLDCVWTYRVTFTADTEGDLLTLTVDPFDSRPLNAQERLGVCAVTVGDSADYRTLTVQSGSGGGSYTNGSTVPIAATFIPGMVFERWIGDTQYVASATSSHTTVFMPAIPIALTATYGPVGNLPHVVMVLADDHGMRYASPYGATEMQTPHMQAMADEGMLFNKAYIASPSCGPSRAAMLTGLMPHRNGVVGNHENEYLKPEVKSLMINLIDMGYAVVWQGKVAHARTGPGFLEEFEFIGGKTTVSVIDTIDAYIAGLPPSTPVAVFIGTTDTHTTWPSAEEARIEPNEVVLPPRVYDTPEARVQMTRYVEAAETVDRILGRVREMIDTRLGKQNTLLMYTSDHGAAWPFGKWGLYEEGTRTPLLAVWPGMIPPGSQNDAMVSWVDIIPTLIDIGGGPAPVGLDGYSFKEVLLGNAHTHRDHIITIHKGDKGMNVYPMRAIRVGKWKYILNLHPEFYYTTHMDLSDPTGGAFLAAWPSWIEAAQTDPKAAAFLRAYHMRPAEELYDLEADPHETTNLADYPQHKQQLEELRNRVRNYMIEVNDDESLSGIPRYLENYELPPSGAVITNARAASVSVSTNHVDLSALGPIDWAFWADENTSPADSKLQGAAIGDLTVIPEDASYTTVSNINLLFSWTNGTASSTGTQVNPIDAGLTSDPGTHLADTGSLLTLSVAGSTSPQRVTVWGSMHHVGVNITALLNGAVTATTSVPRNGSVPSIWTYSTTFTAVYPEDVLTLSFSPYDSRLTEPAQERLGIGAVTVSGPQTQTSQGAPYVWLESYYSNLVVSTDYEAAAAEDLDGDGFTGMEEYWSGTDPTDAVSYFHLTDAQVGEGNDLVISWVSTPSARYSISTNHQLTSSIWGVAVSNIVGQAGSTSYTVNVDRATSFLTVSVE